MMKNLSQIISILVVAMACISCDSGGNAPKWLGDRCLSDAQCNGLICEGYVCTYRCQDSGCAYGLYCTSSGHCMAEPDKSTSGCSSSNPCPNTQICNVMGQCIDIPVPVQDTSECSVYKSCPSGKVCTIQGQCVGNVQTLPQPECSVSIPCSDGKICDINGKCVSMTQIIVQEPECSLTKSCATGMVCDISGHCVSLGNSQPECSDTISCTGNKICSNGQCVDNPSVITTGCSINNPCQSNQVCINGKCLKTSTDTCYSDSDCGDGFACDNQQCVDEEACSLTRTCPGTQVCQNGLCVEQTHPSCDKKHPCADSTKTCIEGICVSCQCNQQEVCQKDGSCVSKGVSVLKNIKLGDDCVWNKDFSFCENNQKFDCVDGKVSVSDCGSNICTVTSEEGIGCHDPCMIEGEFFGECISTGTTDNEISFTQTCERTSDNKLVWTLTGGFTDCLGGCKNGRCAFMPPEFGEDCTEKTYPDACQGDWLTYCYYGRKMGTLCTTYSDNHLCALPSQSALQLNAGLIGVCGLPCTQEGNQHLECISNADGDSFSMNYLCAKTQTDRLIDFEAGYSECPNGCDAQTGRCK